MEIKEIGLWYKFYVPVPALLHDSEDDFLLRSRECLNAFFETYTAMTEERKKRNHPFNGRSLDYLVAEIESLDVRDLELKDMEHCDVQFYVGTPLHNYGRIGIEFLTSPIRTEKKPQMDALKKMWMALDYSFNPSKPV